MRSVLPVNKKEKRERKKIDQNGSREGGDQIKKKRPQKEKEKKKEFQ